MSELALLHDARVLRAAFLYELRKLSAWRVGFFLREVMRGTWRPLVMIFVFHAMSLGGERTVAGWSFSELLRYLILAATFEKLLFHYRGLDLAEQIFEGYVTKYLVMPVRFFVLPLGRFCQHLAVQSLVMSALWILGLLLAGDVWPRPVSTVAGLEALTLVLLGSYCYFLTCFIVNALGFWLEVVWTTLVMVNLVLTFVAGVLVPVSMMPSALQAIFAWLFPYWSISAPIEIALGRASHAHFGRGVLVLAASVVVLELVRRSVWRRGLARYSGSGM